MAYFSEKNNMSAYMVIPCIYRLRCGLGQSVQEAFDKTKLWVAGAGRGWKGVEGGVHGWRKGRGRKVDNLYQQLIQILIHLHICKSEKLA